MLRHRHAFAHHNRPLKAELTVAHVWNGPYHHGRSRGKAARLSYLDIVMAYSVALFLVVQAGVGIATLNNCIHTHTYKLVNHSGDLIVANDPPIHE